MLESILLLFAGVGVFIAGMNMMGDGLESSAGAGMKKLFNKISNNRFIGVGIGASVTAIIQSSAATCVMAIGFVNAGVMTLVQATAIIMGANIGTTITGIIVSLKSLPIGAFVSVLTFVGVMMMFIKKDKVKKIGGILCGLGLIFIGLDLMSSALKGPSIQSMFTRVFSAIDFPLLLILVGAAFTALIQSSSAVTGILITMAGANIIGLDNALFIVLGSNIGTCITAGLASMGTSTNARRTALIHLTFNVVGTVIFTVVLLFIEKYIVKMFETLLPGDPGMQIAWFHVLFNVTTTLLLLPFVKQLVKFATWAIKDKPSPEDEVHQLRFIDDRLLHTPPIAVAQTKKEIMHMAELAKENLTLSINSLLTNEYVNRDTIARNEAKINYTYHAVARYLIKLASLSLSETDEKLVGAYHHVITNIERIGDHAENFVEQADKMKGEGIDFSEIAVAELSQMHNKVSEMFDLAMRAFERRDFEVLDRIAEIEEEVDAMKKNLSASHIERLNKGDCAVERGTYFAAVISALERIADHLINVSYSIKNPTGSTSQRKELNEAK